jgi:hypothetical protein
MAFGTLFDQIRTAYTGNAPLSAALNDLNFIDSLPGTAFPRGTYHYVSGTGDHTAGGARISGRLIQFNLFDDGPDMVTLGAAYDKLQTVYGGDDNIGLLVRSGGRAYFFKFEGDWCFKEHDVFQISCRYRVVDHPS